MRRDLGAGLLSLEECARRIKDLRQQGEALFKRKVELQKKGRAAAKILPIPTPMMNAYIRQLKTAEFDLVWPRKLKTDGKQTVFDWRTRSRKELRRKKEKEEVSL